MFAWLDGCIDAHRRLQAQRLRRIFGLSNSELTRNQDMHGGQIHRIYDSLEEIRERLDKLEVIPND